MPSKKKSRYYPVQSKVDLSSGGICIAPNVLSMINRRHYPATGVYECSIDLNAAVVTGQLNVYALKDNWDTIGAIRLAYKAYLEATKEERAMMSNAQLGRWQDFRIRHGTGLTEMSPMVYDHGVGLSSLTIGEFVNTTVEDSAGNLKAFSIEEPNSLTRYNILTQWSASGNVDADPQVSTAAGAYGGLDSDLSNVQSTQMQTEANEPPYDAQGNDGLTSAWTKVATLTNAVAGADGRLSTGFFRAPLGMILVTGADANAWGVLRVREGSMKGIKVHDILG